MNNSDDNSCDINGYDDNDDDNHDKWANYNCFAVKDVNNDGNAHDDANNNTSKNTWYHKIQSKQPAPLHFGFAIFQLVSDKNSTSLVGMN